MLQERMPDGPDDTETPIQRALRLRKAAIASKPKAPGGEGFNRKAGRGIAPGASQPWMKK